MTTDNKSYFIISFIASLLGGVLILLADFAGYYGNYYTYEEWGYIYFSLGAPIPSLLMLIVALSLFFCMYVSFLGFQGDKDLIKNNFLNYAFNLSLFALIIVLLGGVIFVFAVFDVDDWWFGTGFYGALIGSAVTAFMLYNVKKV